MRKEGDRGGLWRNQKEKMIIGKEREEKKEAGRTLIFGKNNSRVSPYYFYLMLFYFILRI